MEKELTLIKINNDHYVIVDDSEVINPCWVIDKHQQIYYQETDKIFEKFTGCKKITYSTQLLEGVNPLSLSDCQEIEYGYNLEKIFEEETKDVSWGERGSYDANKWFKKGFNIHKNLTQDNLFTIKDMKKAIEIAREYPSDVAGFSQEEIIQSLQHPTQWKVKFNEQNKLELAE